MAWLPEGDKQCTDFDIFIITDFQGQSYSCHTEKLR